jgi:hypothetical protein
MRTLNVTKNNGLTVVVDADGTPKECPFAAPIPVQNAIGQVSLQMRACNSQCLFFDRAPVIFENGDGPQIDADCVKLECVTQIYLVNETDYKNPIIRKA